MKVVSVLIVFSLILVSCSSSTWIKKLPMHEKYKNEINYLGDNRSGSIILKKESEIQTLKILVSSDSLHYVEFQGSKNNAVSLKEIREIKFKDHTIGFFYGFMGGLGIGVATGYASIDWDTDMAGIGMLLYMGVGILVGSIYGGIAGADLNYIIVEQDQLNKN